MKALLDTHVWLWLLGEPTRLRRAAVRTLAAADDLVVSVASVWEVVVKEGLGRLELPVPVADLVGITRDEVGARMLPIDVRHTLGLARLPALHRDPFDRVLVAQAVAEGLTLVTADRAVAAYEVAVFDPT